MGIKSHSEEHIKLFRETNWNNVQKIHEDYELYIADLSGCSRVLSEDFGPIVSDWRNRRLRRLSFVNDCFVVINYQLYSVDILSIICSKMCWKEIACARDLLLLCTVVKVYH